jgi:hypothetical protein
MKRQNLLPRSLLEADNVSGMLIVLEGYSI